MMKTACWEDYSVIATGDGYKLERWGGVMPETAEALAKKAAFSQHAMTQPEREAVVSAARACAARVDAALPRWRRLLFRYWFGL